MKNKFFSQSVRPALLLYIIGLTGCQSIGEGTAEFVKGFNGGLNSNTSPQQYNYGVAGVKASSNSVNGKYSGLLQTLNCPSDKNQYGTYMDEGYWGGGAWCGQQGKAGYWVWVAPNWYVWGNQHTPQNPYTPPKQNTPQKPYTPPNQYNPQKPYTPQPISGGSINGLVEVLRINTEAQALAISPDGRRMVSGGWDNKITLWNSSTQPITPILTIPLQGKGSILLDLAFSPDGRRIVSGSKQAGNHPAPTVHVWDVNTGNIAMNLQNSLPMLCRSVAYSSRGTYIAAGCFSQITSKFTLQVWKGKTGFKLLNIDGLDFPVAFSPDETRVTGGNLWSGTLKLLDTRSGQELLTIQGNRFKGFYSVAFSKDGSQIISGNGDGTLKLWNAHTGQELLTYTGHTKGVNKVAFSPDGKRIASGGEDGTLRLWDKQSGRQLAVFQNAKPFQALRFSDKGHIVSGSDDKIIRVFSTSGTGNASQPGTQHTQQATYVQPPVQRPVYQPPVQQPVYAQQPAQQPVNVQPPANQQAVRQAYIKAAHSGKCLAVQGGSFGDNIPLLQVPCTNLNNQLFEPHPVDATYFTIVAVHSRKCLDVPNGSTANNMPILQYQCNGSDEQQFALRDVGGSFYNLVSKTSGKCFDVPNGSTADNAPVNQYDCDGSNEQKFTSNQ